MRNRRIDFPLLFGLWTLFVWVGRLRNLNADPGGFAEASRWSLIGSIVFTVLGLALVLSVIAGWITAARSGDRIFAAGAKRVFVVALAAVTAVVWLIRATDIARGDHTAAFIAVHVVLAVVSIGLAVLSLRTIRSKSSDAVQSVSTEPGRASVR